MNEEPVTVQLEEGDDLTALACILEEMKFGVNPGLPEILVDGKNVLDVFDKVNYNTTYKFGK